ncbi:Nucleotide-binding universal stress protein, UspA family [Amphritea atlantica]|uniref:Nucleotide-binding universal stress protein, UspA family n=1 Tax=Amphritea atlantica TaxID=355243 RepID=A0A1H9INB2_9GAMM|nr:universal stress protein [Amphritea atlantica]SEQ76113.1 Nucleotide-binding universal stress protein, UspA family [Amphritea atlantica]
MYSNIMVPVSLAHIDQIDKALKVAADLARHYGAKVHYVGVTSALPSEIAHNAEEYAEKLKAFAKEQASANNINAEPHTLISHDPAVELDLVLEHAEETICADLVVVASHLPSFADHLTGSHGGHLASHSQISVFVVR